MKFTKLTLVALLLALLVCAFAACGGETADTDNADGNETEATPVTDPTPETDGEHVHTPVEQIEEATCSQRGYKREICSTCNEQLSVKPIDMVDHVSEKPATCTEYGALYKKCTLCGYKDKESVAMLPHTIDTDAPSYLNVPATCIADGYIKGECIDCHCELNNFNGEYKFGHNIVDKEVVAVANCVADGYSEGKCINPGCGITVKSENRRVMHKTNAINLFIVQISFSFFNKICQCKSLLQF